MVRELEFQKYKEFNLGGSPAILTGTVTLIEEVKDFVDDTENG